MKPCGARLGTRNGEKDTVRLPKILVLIIWCTPQRDEAKKDQEALKEAQAQARAKAREHYKHKLAVAQRKVEEKEEEVREDPPTPPPSRPRDCHVSPEP